MVGFWIRGAQGAIKGVKALKKLKGQKTVTQVRNDASAALIKAASFNYKEGIKTALKKMKDIK
tara:strand:- start:303 stop:491 length:189 start_codon:yes stop_codon:yes gene_type:complete